MTHKFIVELRKLIGESLTDEAFELFKELNIRNQLTLLKARYKDNKRNYRQNIIALEDYNRINSQIHFALLEIITEIEIDKSIDVDKLLQRQISFIH